MFFFSASGRAMSHWARDQRADLELAQPDFHLAAFDLGQVQECR